MSEKEIPKDSLLFYQMIVSFHAAAWQQMGKSVNSLTGKMEKDLQSASISIDMLEMLKTKTSGNLSKEEEEFLDKVLSELRLNYVSELENTKDSEENSEKSSNEEGTDSISDDDK